MNCKYCGAPLKIEDEVCPYCGKPNPEAKEHRRKMRGFKRQYEQTREEVYAKSHFFAKWTVKVTLISVLVVLNLLLLVLHGMAWELGGQMRLIRVRMNREEYIARMETLEKERKFREFSSVYEADNLRNDSDFEHYRAFQYMASQYGYLYTSIMRQVGTEENRYYTPEQLAEDVNSQLGYLYRQLDEDHSWDEEQYTPEHMATMEDLIDEVHLLLKTYWNISAEDLEKFRKLSSGKRQVILERGLGVEE